MDTKQQNRGDKMKIIKYILIVLLIASNAFALDIIPNAKGYGIDTYAGSGRSEEPWSTTVRIVDSLTDDGSGGLTLREAIVAHNAASTPSVILFEVSGTILLTSGIGITKPNLTIAGQTAPSPGIEISSTSTNGNRLLTIYASDVLIQHLRFRPGYDCDNGVVGNLDCFSIDGTYNAVENVVIDHCSFAWSIDEVMSVWGYTSQQISDVTFRNCIFGPSLNYSCSDTLINHGMGPLIGQHPAVTTGATNILFHRNLFSNNYDRNPMLRSEETLLVNNYVYGWGNRATHFAGQSGFASTIQKYSIVGNYYLRESYTWAKAPIWTYGIGSDDSQLYTGSEIYIDDNICPGYSPCYQYSTGTDPFDDGGTDPISWPDGLAAQLISGTDAKDVVLLNVGARPLDRDTVDTDTITNATDETGSLINCVEKDVGNTDCDEVGEYAYVTRPTLANDPLISTLIPASPNADSGSGYTNLEVFLFGYSAGLEPGFTIYGASPTGTGIEIDADLSWTNPDPATITVDVYFEEVSGACDLQIGDRISTGTLITTKDQGTMTEATPCCWRVDVIHAGGTETGTVYEFTTTTGPPAPPAGLAVGVYAPLGMTGVYDDQGVTVGE